jgi:beta-lactam-binding protein with PASTA domain
MHTGHIRPIVARRSGFMRARTVVAVVAACGVTGAASVPIAGAATVRRVPNVVGMNHQAAQDRLQARGFHNLRERDCSGRGRLLLFDRNWRVVRQSPAAGRRVRTSRTITLCSVKYSD